MFDVILTLDLRHWMLLGHVVGLVLGFGSAITIEVVMLRSLMSARTSPLVLDAVVQASKLTTLGLALLWLTGIGFMLYYLEFSPEKLANEKIYAKMVIVLLLTINGWCIHRYLLPLLWKYSGKQVLAVARLRDVLLFALCGSVSAVSWFFPVVFGLNPELNGTYSIANLLGQYMLAVGLIAAVSVSFAVWQFRLVRQRAAEMLTGRGAIVIPRQC